MTISVNSNHINNNATSFKGGAPKSFVIGECTQKVFERLGKCSTPTNRFILGATAMAMQPQIELHNKDVDEDTRRIAWARTIAKIIVGTTTGITIRWGCIKLMDKFTRTPEDIEEMAKKGKKPYKWSKALVPDNLPYEDFGKATRLLKRHRQALGSIAALCVMLYTNFKVDAPLTRILTNVIHEKDVKRQKEKLAMKGEK